jgi:hypothetical protein
MRWKRTEQRGGKGEQKSEMEKWKKGEDRKVDKRFVIENSNEMQGKHIKVLLMIINIAKFVLIHHLAH